MFNSISWGELAVLGGVGMAITGKRDLPRACRFVGHQLGRVVGFLQGGRARLDSFAHQNELKSLQNELRSGLRELDRVKTELAVAASSRGALGRGLGPTTASANHTKSATIDSNSSLGMISNQYNKNDIINGEHKTLDAAIQSAIAGSSTSQRERTAEHPPKPLGIEFDVTMVETEPENNTMIDNKGNTALSLSQQHLPPAAQSERATMEEEWNKQGIGFRARAETGSWNSDATTTSGDETRDTTRATGSELLEDLERSCLIFDQYDRVVGEQEAETERRIKRIRDERTDARERDKFQ
ncbi:unnamed protein product [Pseudo-nitzschia multistriata]|uniref:Sec-independent protein translocase protein TatB n=1 Tax=Pseudo-nitzschia multistriata TaxID=183589 RepID=A0A448Z145_9STRA|nr:unnamed protein product [Pseudo-nitzschia multistriata]